MDEELDEIIRKDKILTAREFIKLLLRTNFSYSLRLGNHIVYNFKYDEELNRLQLLTEENHNFLINSNKIKSITDFINKLLDVNLDAEVYYNDYKILSVYQNSFLRIIFVIVNNESYNDIYGQDDVISLFTDRERYYSKLLQSITGLSMLKSIDTSTKRESWDDLLGA